MSNVSLMGRVALKVQAGLFAKKVEALVADLQGWASLCYECEDVHSNELDIAQDVAQEINNVWIGLENFETWTELNAIE